jgi:choline dehydrogenase
MTGRGNWTGQRVKKQTFDYIVVGAGSAGAVVANRLSADGRARVLLLEAGRASHPLSRIPISFAKFINNPATNWCYDAEPEDSTGQRRIPVPRGRMLGGSSSINGMVFVRGQAQDFDTWAQLGNRGWSYQDVLPFFRRMESYAGGNDDFRGRDGPLKVTDIDEAGPLYDMFFDAAEQIGINRNPDYNGPVQDGISMSQATIRKGRRMSTAHCYLEPARSRSNLMIQSRAYTDRLLLDGRRCVGVRYTLNGETVEAAATREVIVSAGAVNSPKLLELSGIGRPELLRSFGIDVQHALPGVGENLRDHYAPRMKWSVSRRNLTYNDKARGLALAGQVFRYALTGSGFLSLPASPMRAYVQTREGLAGADAGISIMPFLVDPNVKLSRQPGITLVVHQLRPESTGSIHIASTDPQAPPAIRFNFLSDSLDRDVLLSAMRIARKLMATPGMKPLGCMEIAPGASVETDDELLHWVKANAETAYHPVGTCKMGSDAMAVVDERLCVHGMQGLRVADASIMPTLTSGNTNAPSIMIGEKAASLVLESQR